MSLDRMTVCTANNALRDFSLRVIDAFRVADVERLSAFNVVKVKGHSEFPIAAVSAATFDFVSIKPLTNSCRSVVGLSVDAFPVIWISKSALAPYLRFIGFVRPWLTGAFATAIRTVTSSISLGLECSQTNDTGADLWSNGIPWRHK